MAVGSYIDLTGADEQDGPGADRNSQQGQDYPNPNLIEKRNINHFEIMENILIRNLFTSYSRGLTATEG